MGATSAKSHRPKRDWRDKWATIERQFDFIRGGLAKRHYSMEVDYDASLGFPTRIFIDPEQNTADDEITLRMEEFRALAR